ncbi:hypothetical protein AGMMS49982_05610 [Bacteroidia bacterium]|nr:hypothetical protein AGMMS49982_05610 [Bacteroidia bacterium]
MPNEQQEIIKQNAYAESMRYMSNAKETLQKSRKEDDHYVTKRHVRKACGTAYNGVLLALDAFLELKGVDTSQARKSIKFYVSNVAKLDGKLLKDLHIAYDILHLSGYYDGVQDAIVVRRGFEYAYSIIDRIKPDHVVEMPVRSAKSSLFRQMLSLFV